MRRAACARAKAGMRFVELSPFPHDVSAPMPEKDIDVAASLG
jgi:hypothetical protein